MESGGARVVQACLLAFLMAAGPGSAGWLVLDGGERLAIAGSWRVEGQLVLFHRPDGTLASLPLASVDLDATRTLDRSGAADTSSTVQSRRSPSTSGSGGTAVSRDEEIASRVRAWAQAWAEQDVERYLSFYARSFEPDDGTSRAEWARMRRRRLTAPRFIEVEISGLGARIEAGGRARAVFRQRYRSNTYRDLVAKTLELVREDGEWKIVRERLASLVLTDRDVRHLRVVASESVSATDGSGDPALPAREGTSLEVPEWRAITGDDVDGVTIVGSLLNAGKEMALNVSLTVRLLAANGTPLGRARAQIPRSALEPGEAMRFEAHFPGVSEYEAVRFDPTAFDAVLQGTRD